MTTGTNNPEDTRPGTGDELQRARLRRSLSAMNISLSPYAFEIAYARVTTATAKSGELGAAQVRTIVDDVMSSTEILQGVAESFR